jgi:hypothetical protein
MISRRDVLARSAVAAVMFEDLFAVAKVPTMLDHLLLGCSDLDQGIAFVESHTGVRPAIGGVHPGRGTRNALLSLGQLRYLEVIAPNPSETGALIISRGELPAMLQRLASPRLVDWAVHTFDIAAVAGRLRTAGIVFQGPTAGSRTRPDGKILHWQTLNLDEDHNGLLPFFIQWGAGSVHPSVDAPAGCTLDSFAVVSPDNGVLSTEFHKLGIEVDVAGGARAHLRATIIGPKGELSFAD